MMLELLSDTRGGLARAALVEGDRLFDLAIDPHNQPKLYNSLWRVRIDRILPKVGAFAALGEGRMGLLKTPAVKSGDTMIVQLRSVRGEGKADILTTDIAIAGLRFVYLPLSPGIKFSRRTGNPVAMEAATEALIAAGIEGGIVRSGAPAASLEALSGEAVGLRDAWHQAISTPGCGLLREGPDATARLLTDHAGREIRISPSTFEQRGLEQEVAKLRHPRVELGMGGASLMIERTSALTAIDVNTGTAPAGTVNAAAAREIARQIRLRNLSGLIVIDFASPGPRHKGDGLYQALHKALDLDPAGCRIAGVSPSGLVELTRPRRAPPLAEVLEMATGMVTS